jgi:hypothetical protein
VAEWGLAERRETSPYVSPVQMVLGKTGDLNYLAHRSLLGMAVSVAGLPLLRSPVSNL